MKIYLETLGCARNLVDSELILGQLQTAGFSILNEPEGADAIIVNTCSFIEDAVNESIDTILHLARHKISGNCRTLIVLGCLPERYRQDLEDSLPEVDLFLGTGAMHRVADALLNPGGGSRCILPLPGSQDFTDYGNRKRIHENAPTAYLKIADGCNRHCTYCIIPRLRGNQRSRRPEDIIREARSLIRSGVKELALVAQETSFYGKDLTPAADLPGLLAALAALSENIWIRVLYGHPESISDRFIQTVAAHPNICAYFDLPIQHASTPVLKRMGRNYTKDDLLDKIDRIRRHIPDAALRTTVITGFPGETDEDFKVLKEFVQRVRFNHLGVFVYSDSEDLVSHHFANPTPKKIAKQRYDEIMACQQIISMQINQGYVGKTFAVLIEERAEDGLFVGRTLFQAPEVDGITYVHSNALLGDNSVGNFADVKITDALEYDLSGDAT
jgi:ribosomal protein S12 methylthiotransferase